MKNIVKKLNSKRKLENKAHWNIFKRRDILFWMKSILFLSNCKCDDPKDHVILFVNSKEMKIIRYIFTSGYLEIIEIDEWVENELDDIISNYYKNKNQENNKVKKYSPFKSVKSSEKEDEYLINVYHKKISLSDKGIRYKNYIRDVWIQNILPILAIILSVISVVVTIVKW